MSTTPDVIQLLTVTGLPVEEKGGVHARLALTKLQIALFCPTSLVTRLTCPLIFLQLTYRVLQSPLAPGRKASPKAKGRVLGQQLVRDVERAIESRHLTFYRPKCPVVRFAEVIATLNIPVTEALTVFLQEIAPLNITPLVMTCFRWPVGPVRQPS